MDKMRDQEQTPLTFRQFDPRGTQYALRIPNEIWDRYKPTLVELHRQGLTRDQMLDRLDADHDFRPTSSQLHKRMQKWGLNRYLERQQDQRPGNDRAEQTLNHMDQLEALESSVLEYPSVTDSYAGAVVIGDTEAGTSDQLSIMPEAGMSDPTTEQTTAQNLVLSVDDASLGLQFLGVQQFLTPTNVTRDEFLHLFFAEQFEASTDTGYKELLRIVDTVNQNGPQNSAPGDYALFSNVTDFLCIAQACLAMSATTVECEFAIFAEVKKVLPPQHSKFWIHAHQGLADTIFFDASIDVRWLLEWLRRELKGITTKYSLLQAVMFPDRHASWSNVVVFSHLYGRWLCLDEHNGYGCGLMWSGPSTFTLAAWALAPLVFMIMRAINYDLMQAVARSTGSHRDHVSPGSNPYTMSVEWRKVVDQCVGQLQGCSIQDLHAQFTDTLTEMHESVTRQRGVPDKLCCIEQVDQTAARLASISPHDGFSILGHDIPRSPQQALSSTTYQPHFGPRSDLGFAEMDLHHHVPSIARSRRSSSRSSDLASFYHLAAECQRRRADSWASHPTASSRTPESWAFERITGFPLEPPPMPLPVPHQHDGMDIDSGPQD